jgi:hypothetical protein
VRHSGQSGTHAHRSHIGPLITRLLAWVGSRGAIVKGLFFGVGMAVFFAVPGLVSGEVMFWTGIVVGMLSGVAMGLAVKFDWQPSPRVNRWTEALLRVRVPGAAQPPYLPGGDTYLPEESLRDREHESDD